MWLVCEVGGVVCGCGWSMGLVGMGGRGVVG